jgi:hypothetical protein
MGVVSVAETLVSFGGGNVGRVLGVISRFFLAGSVRKYVALVA